LAKSGSIVEDKLIRNSEYIYSCKNEDGYSKTVSGIVTVRPKDLPVFTFSAATSTSGLKVDDSGTIRVKKGDDVTLSWLASGTTKSCSLNGLSYPGDRLIGTRKVNNITRNSVQTMKCTNGTTGGEVIKSIKIEVVSTTTTVNINTNLSAGAMFSIQEVTDFFNAMKR
jgi:hypothetical protein